MKKGMEMTEQEIQSDYLTVKEAAQALKICTQTLWRLIRDGKVPCRMIGGKKLIPKSFVYEEDEE